MLKHRWGLIPGLLLLSASLAWAQPIISPAGQTVTQVLDGMDVTHHWVAGHDVVDWRTGDPIRPAASPKKHTHCSQFVAAAAERLGVYLLRPPDHSPVLLANAQREWLDSQAGRDGGWQPVRGESVWLEARRLANEGNLVVAAYRNGDPAKAGHIAILRPSSWSDQQVLENGPELIQAGRTNYTSTNLRQAFANHPAAYENNQIGFFYHPVPPR
jgi:rhodanese-related sulfurtransferase